MGRIVRSIGALALSAATGWCAAPATAGVTVLHVFDYLGPNNPYAPLLVGQDGRIYGNTGIGTSGGLDRQLFVVGRDGSYGVLRAYTTSSALNMALLLQRPDGTIYGNIPTESWPVGDQWSFNGGAVFRIQPDGSGYQALHQYPSGFTGEPYWPTMLVDGNDGFLYGVSIAGGPDNVGAVFRVATDGSSATTLKGFLDSGGSMPDSHLTMGSDGGLYGVTTMQPTGGSWATFRIDRDGRNFRVVKDWGLTAGPSGAMVEVGGVFYGTAVGGGPNVTGSVFRLTPDGSVGVLHGFDGNDGKIPAPSLALGPDGNFYGLASGGEFDDTTIFRVTPQGGYTTLHLLDPAEGQQPWGGPVFTADGQLVAALGTYYGGTPNGGTVILFDALQPQPVEVRMAKICNKSHDCGGSYDVSPGQHYTVRWNTANATACVASGAWRGSRPTAGRLEKIALKRGTFVYGMACSGPTGAKSGQVTIRVGLG